MAKSVVTVDIEIGPLARGFLDILDLIDDMIDFVPDYHHEEKKELVQRAGTLRELIAREGVKACQNNPKK